MANTFTSSQINSAVVRGNWRGADFTVYGSVPVTSAGVGDVYELVQVPNGYCIESVILDCDQLDSNATPTVTLEVGDAGNAGRFITGSTVGKTGGVQLQNVAASTGYAYAVGTNAGRFSGGNAGATTIQAQVTAAAATFKAGTVRLAVRCFLDPNASGAYT